MKHSLLLSFSLSAGAVLVGMAANRRQNAAMSSSSRGPSFFSSFVRFVRSLVLLFLLFPHILHHALVKGRQQQPYNTTSIPKPLARHGIGTAGIRRFVAYSAFKRSPMAAGLPNAACRNRCNTAMLQCSRWLSLSLPSWRWCGASPRFTSTTRSCCAADGRRTSIGGLGLARGSVVCVLRLAGYHLPGSRDVVAWVCLWCGLWAESCAAMVVLAVDEINEICVCNLARGRTFAPPMCAQAIYYIFRGKGDGAFPFLSFCFCASCLV